VGVAGETNLRQRWMTTLRGQERTVRPYPVPTEQGQIRAGVTAAASSS
jgi:hypothetical protein